MLPVPVVRQTAYDEFDAQTFVPDGAKTTPVGFVDGVAVAVTDVSVIPEVHGGAVEPDTGPTTLKLVLIGDGVWMTVPKFAVKEEVGVIVVEGF